MTLRVFMTPHVDQMRTDESGIRRVIEAYFKYLPDYGIELAARDADSYDLHAVHAGMTNRFDISVPLVSHIHGLYWTADYEASSWEWKANRNVIASMRYAKTITAPSEWVAKVVRRDMRRDPYILPHGIEAQEWRHNFQNEGYILWNKNRNMDVCNPYPIRELAIRFPNQSFVTTFAPDHAPANVHEIGIQPHDKMKRIIQGAGVYLSTTKETFGIGVLEALASGVPVLGFAHGGNLETVEHGVNGYLARVWDYADLAEGLAYCLEHRDVLGANAQETVKEFSWPKACERLSNIYQETAIRDDRPYQIDPSLYHLPLDGELERQTPLPPASNKGGREVEVA